MKIFLIALFVLTSLPSFAQQVIKISINQAGVENCVETGVDQSLNQFSFDVYPNPANEKFTVDIKQSSVNKKYILILSNLLGQTVYQNKENGINGALKTEIDLTNISAGIYILKINSTEFKTSRKILVNGKY